MAKSKRQRTPVNPVQVDLVSDFVCPWCWLGYKQYLDAARESQVQAELTFSPYMLDPNVPENGQDYKVYMRAKFGDGSSDLFRLSRQHLENAGKEIGINFDFSAITRRPNSLSAHRLMKWAQGQTLGHDCAVALFRAYHEQGLDIGDRDVLLGIAQDIGLDDNVVADLFDQDDDILSIQQEAMFFKGLGVSGVPTFIYNGAFAVQGAQEPATHKKAIDKARVMPAPDHT